MRSLIISICVLSLLFHSCKNENSKALQLGEVELAVSGSEEAIPHFERGLLLLHSFEYFDARAAFLKAQELDKDFGMAYWGELMAYNHTLWQRQLTDRAKSVFRKMGPTSETRIKLFKTELEKDLFRSVEILYGDGTKYERDLAYKDFMATLVKKYPNNHEISAFYAISLLGSARNGRDEELYDKCAKIAQSILEENSQHPGALHYLIHAYDDPDHAHMASDAADFYSQVAPDATHALHMPSHIYVALGQWNDVVNSNIASWNASIKKKLKTEGLEGSYHALNWLQYGLLQRNEVQLAQELLDDMKNYSVTHPSKEARSYLIAMKGAHIVETNDWYGPEADFEVETNDLNIVKNGELLFLYGMTAYARKDKDRLNEIVEKLDKDLYAASLNVGDKGFAMCSTDGYASKPPNQLDIDMVSIMLSQLKAKQLMLEGNTEEAITMLTIAAELDETLKYAFGPPFILKPIHEMLAEELFKLGKYDRALEVYDASLKRNPRRLLSLQGKHACLKELNKTEELESLTAQLNDILSKKERAEILKA